MNLYDDDRGEYKQVFCIVSSLMRMRKKKTTTTTLTMADMRLAMVLANRSILGHEDL